MPARSAAAGCRGHRREPRHRARGLPAARRARLRGGARLPGPARGRSSRPRSSTPSGERVVPAHIEVDNSVNIEQLAAVDPRALRPGGRDREQRRRPRPTSGRSPGRRDLSPVAEALDVNLFGAWRVIQALLPLLRSSAAAAHRQRVERERFDRADERRPPGLQRLQGGAQRADQDAGGRAVPGRHPGQRRLPRATVTTRRRPGQREVRCPGRRQRRLGGDPAERRPHRHLHQGRPRAALVTVASPG